jgi:predicted CXXCH cytochrome family protein
MTRNLKTLIIVATVAMGWSGFAYGQSGTVPGRISGTPHDLSGGTAGAGDTIADNNEVCVYCHTPHGSNTGVQAPLWNKPSAGSTYQTYDQTVSITLDAPVLSAVGSVSLACLTCHDGTQAPDTVINAPGSGFQASGIAGANGGFRINTTRTGPAGAALLGTDLRNDHPIGIVYAGQINSTTSAKYDADFTDVATATINGSTATWVDTTGGTSGTREKTDMILYTRTDTGAVAGAGYVECGSCHDPHNDANGRFLRIANAQSAVCLACHTK